MHVVARNGVLVEELGADAQVQRLTRFFLTRALLEAGTLSPESQFHQVLLLKLAIDMTFATDFNDALHVAAFSTD